MNTVTSIQCGECGGRFIGTTYLATCEDCAHTVQPLADIAYNLEDGETLAVLTDGELVYVTEEA